MVSGSCHWLRLFKIFLFFGGGCIISPLIQSGCHLRMDPQSALSSAKHRPLRDRLPGDRPRCGALQGHQVGTSLCKQCRMGQRNEGST